MTNIVAIFATMCLYYLLQNVWNPTADHQACVTCPIQPTVSSSSCVNHWIQGHCLLR